MQEDDVKKLIDQKISEVTAFSQVKYGDTPTDELQLTPKKYVDGKVSSVTGAFIPKGIGTAKGDLIGFSAASVVGRIPVGTDGQVLTASSVASLGVTWSSPASTNLFGDGIDGNVIISSNTSISRDMYFNDLTISNTFILDPSGYQIFVKDTLTIGSGTGTGKIKRVPNDGSNGNTGGTGAGGGNPGGGGGGGAALPSGTLPGSLAGENGGVGGQGRNGAANGGPGAVGTNGQNTNPSIGSNGVSSSSRNGGQGGPAGAFTGGIGGIGGTGGTTTAAQNTPDSLFGCFIHADLTSTYTQHQGSASSAGSGSGGGGAGVSTQHGGGGGAGGGAGSNGGFVTVFAKNIINNSADGISAPGGRGGDGGVGGAGDPATNQTGGGGGGQGGNGGTGGVVIIVYSTLTQNGTFTASGGQNGVGASGGAGGAGGGAGQSGLAGFSGNSGAIWLYQV